MTKISFYCISIFLCNWQSECSSKEMIELLIINFRMKSYFIDIFTKHKKEQFTTKETTYIYTCIFISTKNIPHRYQLFKLII